jgi:hypothetical protein
MAWELIVPDPPPPGCCELTALLVALGQIYGAAEAALTRREGELLSSMAIDEREAERAVADAAGGDKGRRGDRGAAAGADQPAPP